jgi:hypothetical protein
MPKAAGAWAGVLREGERGGRNVQQAGLAALLSLSSSFSERTALTVDERGVTDFRKRRVEWPDGAAKSRRRRSGRERPAFERKGRIGEVNTATSSASADATQIPRLRVVRSDIVPRIPGPFGNAGIIRGAETSCQCSPPKAPPDRPARTAPRDDRRRPIRLTNPVRPCSSVEAQVLRSGAKLLMHVDNDPASDLLLGPQAFHRGRVPPRLIPSELVSSPPPGRPALNPFPDPVIFFQAKRRSGKGRVVGATYCRKKGYVAET